MRSFRWHSTIHQTKWPDSQGQLQSFHKAKIAAHVLKDFLTRVLVGLPKRSQNQGRYTIQQQTSKPSQQGTRNGQVL